ncbi:MAG: glycosyltransferase [Candidatus Eremiobacteraeota bacterium]|nr:glycosyltransferase [Candidatus Eremiobacteraeota bacterium]
MADRTVPGPAGEQPGLRPDVGLVGVRAAHARRHRAGSRRRNADVRVAFGGDALRVRSRSRQPRALRERGAHWRSESSIRDRALRRQRARRNAIAGIDRGVQGAGRRRFRQQRDDPGSADLARGGILTRKLVARLHQSHAHLNRRNHRARRATRRSIVPRQSDDRLGTSPRHQRQQLNVALVHDYLNQRGGAERVFAHIARAWPEAPVYTSLYDERVVRDLVPPDRVRLSYLSRVPLANRFFRALAPLYPRAFESFDLSGFDAIVSSTTAWAKGVRVPPRAVHVCYINTVSRFAFAYDEYVRSPLLRPLVDRLARWDRLAATRPTRFVANSDNVAKRIRKHYGRDADVLHCPVDVERFTVGSGAGDYFVVAARLLPYKRVDLAIRAAGLAGVKLFVAGSGPAEGSLRSVARGTTATMLGFVSDARLNELIGNARAVIVPGEEDFGLVPLEAAAAGRPAIAYRGGGALETIVEGETGAFFDEPNAESLAAVLRSFSPARFDPQRLRAHAERFAPPRFIERLRAIVDRVYREA